MFSRRSGQTAGAAAFVAIITLFIIIWILFLPPAERERILNNDTGMSEQDAPGRLLLKEYPRTILVESQDEFEHTISPVNLFVIDEDQVLKRREAVLVQQEQDGEGPFRMAFHIDEPENVQASQLLFSVQGHEGSLIVTLNDEQIFSGEITSGTPQQIPLDDLQEDNILEFSVLGGGWQFWKVNYYQLENVRVIASIRNLRNREASTQFSVNYDPQIVKSAQLRFLPDCETAEVGRLTLTLNDRVVTSKVPECGSLELVDFDPSLFLRGTNVLSFRSDVGAMLIDNIRIRTELEEPIIPVYYFELNRSVKEKVELGTRDIELKMTFAGDEPKVGTINVNNRKLSFNQNEPLFSRKIGQYVIEGNNFLQIIPERTVDIQELTVSVADK